MSLIYQVQESTCNKFGAIGPGGYTHPVSGILALSCRHELLLPQSIIDLISNEKYVNLPSCVRMF